MTQQTAVDLFMAYVSKHKEFLGYDLDEVYEQAKQMEKEQIMDAIVNNQNGLLRRKTVLEAEQYYNETYGTEQSTK